MGSNKPSLTNMSASSNISSPHPTSSCPLAHKALPLFLHPIYFHSDEIYLILWTSYQNLCAGSESWKTWQKKKCSMCVLLGQELVVCCMFLSMRRKLGNTFMYAIVFQSLNFRCASKSRVNSGNSKNLSWLRCWTAAENQIQWCHNVTKIVRKHKNIPYIYPPYVRVLVLVGNAIWLY